MAALQKMFSAGTAAGKDEATQEYLAAMPFAANEALHRIAAARPLRRSVELDADTGGEQGFLLEEYAPDYKNSGPLEVYALNERDVPQKLAGCRVVAGRYLVTPPLRQKAALLLCYEAAPVRLKADTSDGFKLPLKEDAAALVPLYLAGEIYKEDDANLSAYYMNEFEVGLASLAPEDAGVQSDAFFSESGW